MKKQLDMVTSAAGGRHGKHTLQLARAISLFFYVFFKMSREVDSKT